MRIFNSLVGGMLKGGEQTVEVLILGFGHDRFFVSGLTVAMGSFIHNLSNSRVTTKVLGCWIGGHVERFLGSTSGQILIDGCARDSFYSHEGQFRVVN